MPTGKTKTAMPSKRESAVSGRMERTFLLRGATIGHIVNNVYVPIQRDLQSISKAPVTLKDWANVALCMSLSTDIREEIGRFYTKEDADKIYSIAILRVCDVGIKDYQLKAQYEESFLSEDIPGVALSKNTVCSFINNLGKSYTK